MQVSQHTSGLNSACLKCEINAGRTRTTFFSSKLSMEKLVILKVITNSTNSNTVIIE